MSQKRTHASPPSSYLGYVLAGVGVYLLFRKWKGVGGDPVDVSAEAYDDMIARVDMTGQRSKLTPRDRIEKLGDMAEQMMIGGGYTKGQILDARSAWLKKNAPGQFPALEALTSSKLASLAKDTSKPSATSGPAIPKKSAEEKLLEVVKLFGKAAEVTEAIATPSTRSYGYTPDEIAMRARSIEALGPVPGALTPKWKPTAPKLPDPEKERPWIDPSIAAEATALALEDLRRTPRSPVGITYVPEGRTESIAYIPEKKASFEQALTSTKAPVEDIAMKMGADWTRRIAETQAAMLSAQQAAMRAVRQTSLTQALKTASVTPKQPTPSIQVARVKPRSSSAYVMQAKDTAPQQALPVFDSSYTS
jgi:hypothetical protein